MIEMLEVVSDKVYLFVDLFFQRTIIIAIKMYEGLGYSVFKRLREYYGRLGVGGMRHAGRSCSLLTEDLELDLRKPFPGDPKRRSVRPNGRDKIVSACEVS